MISESGRSSQIRRQSTNPFEDDEDDKSCEDPWFSLCSIAMKLLDELWPIISSDKQKAKTIFDDQLSQLSFIAKSFMQERLQLLGK